MDLDNFRAQILNGLVCNDQQILKQAEENFYTLLNQNPCLALQLLIANSNTNDKTNSISITLLGTAALLLSSKLSQIGDIQFHQNFQSSLLALLQSQLLPPHLLSNISFIISRYSKIYSSNWPSLFDNLLQIIQNSNYSPFAIDCLSYCITNNSIVCNDQALQVIIQLIQGIFNNSPYLNPQFFSAAKLIFSLYQCEKGSDLFKSNLKIFSEKLASIDFSNSDQALQNNFMIKLANFSDDSIDFFEPSFNIFINFLCSKICSQSSSEIVENMSILILKYIFCNKKYIKIFEAKSLEIYNLLVKVISVKLPEIDIDPNEGENTLNESNTISIAEDAINSIAHNYGGINDVSIYLLTSFYEQEFNDFGLFISNFIAFGCVINEIIDFVDLPTFIQCILPRYKMGFTNQNMNCRYRSIVSLKKVLKALQTFPGDLDDISSQDIILLIFETLSKENIPANRTALLKALKSCLIAFDDYHDNIGNIILPLEQNFNSFTIKQQSVIISCYSYCADLCENNGPYQNLMLTIYNRILTVLQDLGRNFSTDLFFICLDSVLSFYKFVPSESFIQISSLILKFISTFGSINQQNNGNNSVTTMMDVLNYKQVDIINRTLRGLIQKCPKDQILAFSNQVFQPIFMLASSDINQTKSSFDDNKLDLQTNYEIVRCPEENNWICYSKNSISNVYEALFTIHSIVSKFPEIIDPYLQQLLQIIQKWINGCFSFTLVNKCAQILLIILENNEKMKQPEMMVYILTLYVKIMNAFNLIGDESKSNETINFIQLYNKIFGYIGLNFNSPNTLSIVVGSENPNGLNSISLIFNLYSKWVNIHQLSMQNVNDINADNVTSDCARVETQIGFMFDPIFKYFSCQPVIEKIMPLIFQFFPMNFDANYFITPTYVGAYSSFVVYSSLCNQEQVIKIGSLLANFMINGLNSNFPSDVTQRAAEAILRIANSGRITAQFFVFIIEKIEQAIQIKKDKIDSFVVPQLLILIENVIKNTTNIPMDDSQKNQLLVRLISLLLGFLPVNFMVMGDFTYQSAGSLCVLLSTNHPILGNQHNMALVCSLMFVFIKVHKPPKPILDQLKNFIKIIFFGEQGQAVYNELMALNLSPKLHKDCENYIARMIKLQSKQG